jgi:hypothetical protein
MRDLVRVVLADHVVVKTHNLAAMLIALQVRRPGRVLETAVRPMAMRRHDARKWALLSARTIQVAAEIEARKGFEQHLLDRIAVALEFAEDLRVERPLLRHRQQSRTGQDLLSQKRRPLLPRVACREDGHFVVCA